MKSDPFFVSAIIPVFNGEAYLAEAVESIQRQKYEPLEIIIVDDGSTDNTADVVAELKTDTVRYVYQPNSGAAAARNRGLEMAQGNVIAFLDADDLWSESKLALQLTCLKAQPEIEVVLGYVQWMRLTSNAGVKRRFEKFAEPFCCFSLASALFRKSAFDKVGLCDPALRYSEDVDWFMRAREQGIWMVMLEQVTLFYRLHQSNTTRGKDPTTLNVLKVIKMSLDRRRQSAGLAKSLSRIPRVPVSIACSHEPTEPGGETNG